ncbi:hypothetical protein COV49_04165 [Candidatus Falkowbacteria bacterium CG11_big_fil_rev_8_21_14_0_20_39_10]|uniref:Uncharacterized protein n=1 Tax=Candidatus Falkowbacteria bacterium CG11_big_fil_rev_8_21_14_0_20_39_10 TaxID=1974570 RepID=A0A2M6K858_9BACT|nr:MAG: hypothetical protein COV49_04165 [Candidatus Falkowbacteria bacterium CG11_big_fil_rev_8_21_14_0_20_39_10]
MNYLNKKIISFTVLTFLFFCVLAPTVLAVDTGLDTTAEVGYGKTLFDSKIKGDKDISSIIGKIVGSLLAFIGVIFFVLIIYGGFMWMTAQGNEEQVNKAIEIMKQAIFGIIVVAAAYLLTKFIGETVIDAF